MAQELDELVQRLRQHAEMRRGDVAAEGSDTRPRAAVLVALSSDPATGQLCVLLTKRSEELRSHAGDVCFPGGREDPGDGGDPALTALREAHEEVGLPPVVPRLLGRLSSVISRNGLRVTPVVAWIPPSFAPVPNDSEVASCFSAPLAGFLDGTFHNNADITTEDGRTFRLHEFFARPVPNLFTANCTPADSFRVYGMTAWICIEAAMVLLRATPQFELRAKL